MRNCKLPSCKKQFEPSYRLREYCCVEHRKEYERTVYFPKYRQDPKNKKRHAENLVYHVKKRHLSKINVPFVD